MAYKVFHRTWWRREAGRLVPGAGRKTTIAARVETEAEAREICRQWNASHDHGPLSRKAEYESR